MLLTARDRGLAEAESAGTADSAAPTITVTLHDSLSGGSCASPGEATVINAAVIYENCVKDREYTVVLRLENSTDGGQCAFADGAGTVSCVFIAEASAGRVDTALVINTAD